MTRPKKIETLDLPGIEPAPVVEPEIAAAPVVEPEIAAAPVVEPEIKIEAPQPAPVQPQIAKRKIKTVYGDMVCPLSGVRFTQIPQDIEDVNGWVKSQLDARKMEFVA